MITVVVALELISVLLTGCAITHSMILGNDINEEIPLIITDSSCNMHQRNTSCPQGYCCVSDEFLPTDASLNHCRRIGLEGDHCTRDNSNSDCACSEGLICRPNIITPTFASFYGKCRNATDSFA